MVAPVANRPPLASKTAVSQGPFPDRAATRLCGRSSPFTSHKEIPRTHVRRYHHRHRPTHPEPDHNPTFQHAHHPDRTLRRQPPQGHDGRYLVDTVAVTAGDTIESLRQWASGRCLSADQAGVYCRVEQAGTRARRVMRQPGRN